MKLIHIENKVDVAELAHEVDSVLRRKEEEIIMIVASIIRSSNCSNGEFVISQIAERFNRTRL